MKLARVRTNLAQDFATALAADFAEHGAKAIAVLRETKLDVYLRLVAAVEPSATDEAGIDPRRAGRHGTERNAGDGASGDGGGGGMNREHSLILFRWTQFQLVIRRLRDRIRPGGPVSCHHPQPKMPGFPEFKL